jgi:NAD(P)-dependent dehydrogenase (short-subunit alcohol dehydrogenase family)
MDIQDKVFIVTGGASGLGAGAARMLARKGAVNPAWPVRTTHNTR